MHIAIRSPGPLTTEVAAAMTRSATSAALLVGPMDVAVVRRIVADLDAVSTCLFVARMLVVWSLEGVVGGIVVVVANVEEADE